MAAHSCSDRCCLTSLLCKQSLKYRIVPQESGIPQGSTGYEMSGGGSAGLQDVAPGIVPDVVPGAVLIAWTDR